MEKTSYKASNILAFPFECTGPLLWLHWTISLILLKCQALNVVTASLRHRNAERSPFRWRALGN